MGVVKIHPTVVGLISKYLQSHSHLKTFMKKMHANVTKHKVADKHHSEWCETV